jgi:hypothetical protein
MSLDFKLKLEDGKKSDTAIMLILMCDTRLGKIKWEREYKDNIISRYFSNTSIEGTKKFIRIESFFNDVRKEFSNLYIFLCKDKHLHTRKMIKDVRGEDVYALLKYIKEQLKNE